jgi:hypothetical protein
MQSGKTAFWILRNRMQSGKTGFGSEVLLLDSCALIYSIMFAEHPAIAKP